MSDGLADAIPDPGTLPPTEQEAATHITQSSPLLDQWSDPKLVLEAWKITIETQRHFNDVQMTIRNVAISVFVAIFTAAGFALKERLAVSVFNVEIGLAGFVLIAGIIAMLAFYLVDWGYYHLLLGAVDHGYGIEERYKDVFPPISHALKIRDHSHAKLFGIIPMKSAVRFHMFYLMMIIIMISAVFGATLVVDSKQITSNPKKQQPLTTYDGSGCGAEQLRR